MSHCLKSKTQIPGWFRKEETYICHISLKVKEKCKGKRPKRERGSKRQREEDEDRKELGSIILPVKAERQRRESERSVELGRRGEFTKAAQEGPHYDIKQDLISESDLMR